MVQSTTTFARPTFAKLSPHPFLLANLQPPSSDSDPGGGTRTNGRSPRQARPLNCNTSSLSHAHGSAVVRAGDTTVICGVRGEILPVANIPNYRAPSRLRQQQHRQPGADEEEEKGGEEEGRRELVDYDLLVPNIELATGCAPQFLPGVPPTTLAQTLSSRVLSLLYSSRLLAVEDLRVWYHPASIPSGTNGSNKGRHTRRAEEEDDDDDDDDDAMDEEGEIVGKRVGEVNEGEDQSPRVMAYWTLYIDVLFISFDGNPFDVAWAAILAALRDVRLPQARWDPDREMVVCSRPTSASRPARPLSMTGFPVACTAAVFRERDDPDAAEEGRYWVLVDPDREEEGLCGEFVTVVVDRSGDADGKDVGEVAGEETKVLSILKTGGTAAGPEFIVKFVELAGERWAHVRVAIMK